MKARLLLLVVLFIAAAVGVAASGEYRTVEVESLTITIDSEWAARTAPGYLPVRFEIANAGEARVIEIVGEGSRFFRAARSYQGGSIVRQAVRLARGDRVRLTLPVPVYADSENIRFEIRENGRALERFNYTSFESKSLPADTSTLVVGDPGTPFGQAAPNWIRTRTSMTSSSSSFRVSPPPTATGSATLIRPTMPPLDFVLPPARLPSNWVGFTSLRAVVIGRLEWLVLAEAQKTALLSWTACGGDLLLVDGQMSDLFPSPQSAGAAAATGAVRAYFFGRIHLLPLASLTVRGLAAALADASARQDSNWGLPVNRSSDWGVIGQRGFRLPIPGVGGVPARSYLTILVLFSLLNLFIYSLLWRSGRQVLMVLTTPLVSAVFIVLLGVYVVAGEGLGVRGRAMTVTMLDQVRRQAATRASVSLYAAGMSPSGGLRFPRDVAVFPIGADGSGSRELLALDLTETQRFSAGVIQARAPTNLEQLTFRSARERLTFSRDGGGIAVVNGLGTDVTALVYRVGDQVYTLSGVLPAGGRAVLTAGIARGVDLAPGNLPLSSRFQHLVEHAPAGAYLAVLRRSPFWEAGVTAVDERDSFHFVIGWPEGQP